VVIEMSLREALLMTELMGGLDMHTIREAIQDNTPAPITVTDNEISNLMDLYWKLKDHNTPLTQ
jgi:hypothetical protein